MPSTTEAMPGMPHKLGPVRVLAFYPESQVSHPRSLTMEVQGRSRCGSLGLRPGLRVRKASHMLIYAVGFSY